MKHTILFLLVTLTGCGDHPRTPRLIYKPDCSPQETEKLANWMLECIKRANPKSDEEPEDWILQCERTGKRTLCSSVPAVRFQTCHSCTWNSVACSKVTKPHLKAVCPSE